MREYTTINIKKKKEGGYILLLAMLISSIMLAVALGIYSISLKQVVLTSFLRESQVALSASDRAMECALFWDRGGALPYTLFATSSTFVPPAGANTAQCIGLQLNTLPSWSVFGATLSAANTDFSLTFADGTCADVTVSKNDIFTTITSRGFNTCNVGSPRRTQRTLEINTNL